jgi:hypothetical protein
VLTHYCRGSEKIPARHATGMPARPTRSLRHEYELYVEHEIERYKDSVPRNVLMTIGDEAVASLSRQQQLTLTELMLWEEVDRLIVRRLRLPAYATWRRKRLRLIAELRRPEHWGLAVGDAVVRALGASERSAGQVLVAGASDEAPAMYFAANGCRVTTLDADEDAVERVVAAAVQAGLADQVQACVGDLLSWSPDAPLAAVIVSPGALAALGPADRARVLATLQRATVDGGVHLLRSLAASGRQASPFTPLTVDELRASYRGWDVSVESGGSEHGGAFVARKGSEWGRTHTA